MYYYNIDGKSACSFIEDLPFEKADATALGGQALFLHKKPPLSCRTVFPVSHSGQLTVDEDVRWLDLNYLDSPPDADLPEELQKQIAAGKVSAVNIEHPRWKDALDFAERFSAKGKKQLNLLALGDVGSTAVMAMALLGGDAFSSIGIYDVTENAAARWEMEINQFYAPEVLENTPEIRLIGKEELFDCDIFAFCASKSLPAVGEKVADVRMAQFESNLGLVSIYGKMAAEARFKGLFAVVSDPVDLLCKGALFSGGEDAPWLFPEQVQGFGLGVMNARARYHAAKNPHLGEYLINGRAYGPHGEDLVIANAPTDYDHGISMELTRLTVETNLRVRDLGFKPYAAPAVSSAAMPLISVAMGIPHFGAIPMGDVYMGCKNAFTPLGVKADTDALHEKLVERIETAAQNLRRHWHGRSGAS